MNLRSYGPQISLIERKSKSDEKNFSAKYVKDQMKKKKNKILYLGLLDPRIPRRV